MTTTTAEHSLQTLVFLLFCLLTSSAVAEVQVSIADPMTFPSARVKKNLMCMPPAERVSIMTLGIDLEAAKITERLNMKLIELGAVVSKDAALKIESAEIDLCYPKAGFSRYGLAQSGHPKGRARIKATWTFANSAISLEGEALQAKAGVLSAQDLFDEALLRIVANRCGKAEIPESILLCQRYR
jgi:hypothetical protein